ncbi:hypothetical protein PBI_SCTP2_210 [Salicola phage SCTP-2]|nr:hypothetical protein PBI_SCTP2_210 [Salicola phage SCTP-2]
MSMRKHIDLIENVQNSTNTNQKVSLTEDDIREITTDLKNDLMRAVKKLTNKVSEKLNSLFKGKLFKNKLPGIPMSKAIDLYSMFVGEGSNYEYYMHLSDRDVEKFKKEVKQYDMEYTTEDNMDLFYGAIHVTSDLEHRFYRAYKIPVANYIGAFAITRDKETGYANAYVKLFKNVDTGEEVSYDFRFFGE